jgi:signal transduction histidine kinase
MTAVRIRPGHLTPRAIDVLLAIGVAAVLSVVLSASRSTGPGSPLLYLWSLAFGAPMLVRRQLPLAVLLFTAMGYFAYYATGSPPIGVAVPIAAAVFSAAEAGLVISAAAVSLALLVISTVYRVLGGQDPGYVIGYELAGHVLLLASVILLGHSMATRRDLVRRRQAVAALVAHQVAADADLRAREERLELARELHDSMGHSLTVASLYTSVAREAKDDPERRQQALDRAKTALSEAMRELRSTVALLRTLGSAAPSVTLHPRAEIERVLQAPRTAGFRVDASVDELDVAEAVASTAVRLVQESVTNTLKHSNASAIRVHVQRDRQRDQVIVEVADDGTTGAADGHRGNAVTAGHGIAGMRERVEALGGSLEVRPGPDGWTVRSEMPAGGTS